MSVKDSYNGIQASLLTLNAETAPTWTITSCGLKKNEEEEGYSIEPWQEHMQSFVDSVQSNYDTWCDRLIALEQKKGKSTYFAGHKKKSDDGSKFRPLGTILWEDVSDDEELDQYREFMREEISTFETDLQAQRLQANVVLANAGLSYAD
jgi:hypothetical protein